MTRREILEEKVRALYKKKDPKRNDWADWLYENHVFLVGKISSDLAKKYKADEELAYISAILHDVGDTVTKRKNENHESETLRIAKELLLSSGFEKEKISEIVDDALKFHSCIDGEIPKSMTGKILATSDAIAHLTSNFYDYCEEALKSEMNDTEIKNWILKKLDRDYNDKILFEDEENEMKIPYENLKKKFS